MSRTSWAIAVLVAALIAAWYARMLDEKAAVKQTEVETQTQAEAETEPPPPLPELPVERPEKLQLKRIADDPAIEAQLPEPCPLTAIEYRYGSLMTNVLVERFDDNSTARNVVLGRRRIQVNTDGAANSYHSRVIKADDEAVGAINIICNAQTKIFKKTGETKKPIVCRQNAYSVTDEYATAYEELRSKNWEDTDSGYSIQFDWNIIGKGSQVRPDGPFAPCIKEDGFFVAKTRLRLRPSANECDASIYPDSNLTSAFVLPINWFANYQKKEVQPGPVLELPVWRCRCRLSPGRRQPRAGLGLWRGRRCRTVQQARRGQRRLQSPASAEHGGDQDLSRGAWPGYRRAQAEGNRLHRVRGLGARAEARLQPRQHQKGRREAALGMDGRRLGQGAVAIPGLREEARTAAAAATAAAVVNRRRMPAPMGPIPCRAGPPCGTSFPRRG